MNIAFVVNNFPPRTGGVEAHVQSLARALVRLGHNVYVITLGYQPGWRSESGIHVLTLREHFRIANVVGFPKVGTRRRLSKFLDEKKIDVVSVHTRFFPMSYLGLRAAKKCSVSVIHTEHGSGHVVSESLIIRWASRMVDYTIGRTVLRRADQVLGVSENVNDFVHTLAGVNGEIFYNAIDVEDSDSRKFSPRPNHLLFVGRIVPGKGWQDFLELVSRLTQQSFKVSGEIIGDGSDTEKMRAAIDYLGLNSIVQFRGRLPTAQVRQALRGATLINPSTLAEGFQTTLLEALAESGSVVTYDVSGAKLLQQKGAPIVVTEERTVASLYESVTKILNSPMEPVSPNFMKEWSWESRAQQFANYCSILTNQTRSGPTQDEQLLER